MMGRWLTLLIGEELEGRRVDSLLRRSFQASGTVIKAAKRLPDGILLDGERVFTNALVRRGQTLSLRVDTPEAVLLPPSEGPLSILYEDEDLLVLNKAAGLPVHPGPGHPVNTVGNFLSNYYKKKGEIAAFHPVNRLDRGTSGLMAVAKHPYAQERLKQALHTGEFQRTYLAVCQGVPQPRAGVVEAPIGREEGALLRRIVRPDGKPARTSYQVVQEVGGRSLIRLELQTGRTHQIRVHMAYLGHPLTGDFLYGQEEGEIERPALHSAQIRLIHPITGKEISLSAPLPQDMKALLSDDFPHACSG